MGRACLQSDVRAGRREEGKVGSLFSDSRKKEEREEVIGRLKVRKSEGGDGRDGGGGGRRKRRRSVISGER